MPSKKAKYFIGFIIIVGAVAYLLTSTLGASFQYYVTASELVKGHDRYARKVLKVAGVAGQISTHEESGKTIYQFNVKEGGEVLTVSYGGLVPDTFKEGSEVVVTGELLDDGTFKATEILAKCASKYEAKMDQKQ